MIKTQNSTPDVYYKHSRDFQFIGRLFDLVLNSVKTNTELVYNLPLNEDSDDKLVDLLAMTLGFKARHDYNINQLKAICSAFALILRNKGNIQAIDTALKVLFNADGLKDILEYDIKNNQILLYIPTDLTNMNLLIDLMPYVLPAGITCKYIKTTLVKYDTATELEVDSKVQMSKFRDYDLSKVAVGTSLTASGQHKAVVGTIGHTTVVRVDKSKEA